MRKYNNILVLSLLSLTLVGCNGKTPITDLKEKLKRERDRLLDRLILFHNLKKVTVTIIRILI